MELHLPPLATVCAATARPFAAGDRVVSRLVRDLATGALARFDVAEAASAGFAVAGAPVCQWVQVFKARTSDADSARLLRLNAENLFLTLADPSAPPAPENARLIQFLALVLERKKILRPRGPAAGRSRQLYEHARTKQLYEVPTGELSPEFFLSLQEQLGVLVGGK
ncbi:MAG: hypothetical protein WCL04_00500 [Verrucomicrobiota bacterium]